MRDYTDKDTVNITYNAVDLKLLVEYEWEPYLPETREAPAEGGVTGINRVWGGKYFEIEIKREKFLEDADEDIRTELESGFNNGRY